MNSNSENPRVGAMFQKAVAEYFQNTYKKEYILEKPIPIGTSDYNKKDHKFDIVAADDSIAIECKCYTWTETGNVPSTKMGFVNEAAFYLSFLPDSFEKYIVMLRAKHEKRNETLAEYYVRMNKHLLGNTKVAEYDPVTNDFRVIECSYLLQEDVIDNTVIIKINQAYRADMSALELYDVTRGCWKRNKKSVQDVKYALAVYYGEVKEVYRIDRWVPAEEMERETLPYNPVLDAGRIAFFGEVAKKDVRDRYIGKSVAKLFKKGEASPVKVIKGARQ